MDSRKPLTAGAEELIERIETALALHNEGGPLASTPMKIPAGAYRALVDAKRLLSILPPPPDAAVREAVERLDAYTGAPGPHLEYTASGGAGRDLRTLLRAVQSPRLTVEQVETVKAADKPSRKTLVPPGTTRMSTGARLKAMQLKNK